MAAHAPERVAFQTWLCAERVERLTSLRDLSLAEEWGEHLNNGLNVRAFSVEEARSPRQINPVEDWRRRQPG